MSDIEALAGKLTEAQRALLFRHEPTTDEQPISVEECFDANSPEYFIETSPDQYDEEFGVLLVPAERAWIAVSHALSPERSTEFTECWLRYTTLGLALRAHLQANPIPDLDSKEEGR